MQYHTINGETLHFDILDDIGHFWLISVFEIQSTEVTFAKLRVRLRQIVSQTPSLRFRFIKNGDAWVKSLEKTPAEDDFIFLSKEDDLEAVARKAVEGVSIDQYPLSRFALVNNSNGRFLISILNHMTTDAISVAHIRKQIVSDEVLNLESLSSYDELEDENSVYEDYYRTVQKIAGDLPDDSLEYWRTHGQNCVSKIGAKVTSGKFSTGIPISSFDTQTFAMSDSYVQSVMKRFSSSFDGSLASCIIAKILSGLAREYGSSTYPFWLVDGGRPRDKRFARDHSQTCGELAFPVPVYPFIDPALTKEDVHAEVHRHVEQARDNAIDFSSKYWNEADNSELKAELRKLEQPIIQVNYRGSVFEPANTAWAKEVSNDIIHDPGSHRIYDICFNIHRFQTRLECEVVYNADRFPKEEISRLIAHLETPETQGYHQPVTEFQKSAVAS